MSEPTTRFWACNSCHGVAAPRANCVPSSRRAATSSVAAVARKWLQWLVQFTLGDFVPFLYECDVCENYFCNDCAAEVLGDLRFCPTCTGTARAMSIVLEDPQLQKDAVVWRHVGNILNAGESIDVVEQAPSSTSAAVQRGGITPASIDSLGGGRGGGAGRGGGGTLKSYSKVDCLAKALELNPTRRHWASLAAAMDWSDTIAIAVNSTSSTDGGSQRSWSPATTLRCSINALIRRLSPEPTPSNKTPTPVRSPPPRSANAATAPLLPSSGTTSSMLPGATPFTLSCRDVFTIAIHIDPTNPTTWCNLALAMPPGEAIALGHVVFSKLDCFARALQLEPTNETALVSYAISLWEANQKGSCNTSAVSLTSMDALPTIPTNCPRAKATCITVQDVPLVERTPLLPNGVTIEQGDRPVDVLLRALKLNPTSAVAWSALATIMRSDVVVDAAAAAAIDTLIGVDCSNAGNVVTCLTALRVAATLALSEASIFKLAMFLTSGSRIETVHRIFSTQAPDANGVYALTRKGVLESLAELHIAAPKRFPLTSAQMSFAITCTCPTSPSVVDMNARCLITNMMDIDLAEDGACDRVVKYDPVAFPWTAKDAISIALTAPMTVVHRGKTYEGEGVQFRCVVELPCIGNTNGTTPQNVLKQSLIIGQGQQGCVLRAVMRDNATNLISFMAVKVFLYVPTICTGNEVVSSGGGGGSAAASAQDSLFEELLQSSGDLRFLLSESLNGIAIAGRYAAAMDLSDAAVFASRSGDKGCYTPGKFVLPCEVASVSVPVESSSGIETIVVQPKPFLVMLFMDRALFALNQRCSNEGFQPLPTTLISKVFRVAPTTAEHAMCARYATAPTFRHKDRFMLEAEARYYLREMTRHLNRLHHKGFAHGDVKPDNILMMPNGDVRLADFGVAWRRKLRLSELHQHHHHRETSMSSGGPSAATEEADGDGGGQGTYLAPMPKPGAPTAPVGAEDVWALGQSLRFLLTSLLPLPSDPDDPTNESRADLEDISPSYRASYQSAIVSGGSSFAHSLRRNVSSVRLDLIDHTATRRKKIADGVGLPDHVLSPACVEFLSRCLCQHAHERATCSELLTLPFLSL